LNLLKGQRMKAKKRRLLPASFLLFLAVGPLASTPSQDQPQRPRFYALEAVCEKNVHNAKDSLGAPDGRYAEVFPGGQLIILMENKLYPLPMAGWSPEGPGGVADSGSIVGKAETEFGLEGWFPMQDNQGKQHYDWIPLGPSATGFCLFPPPTYPFEGKAGVDMIRITNAGTKSLFIDAVIGYGEEPV